MAPVAENLHSIVNNWKDQIESEVCALTKHEKRDVQKNRQTGMLLQHLCWRPLPAFSMQSYAGWSVIHFFNNVQFFKLNGD